MKSFDLDEALPILEATPGVLRALLGALPETWIHATEGPGTWSAFDVVGHLIHGEKTDWPDRMRIILAPEGDKRFAPFDRFAQFETSGGKTLAVLLDEFAQLRAANLVLLRRRPLGPSDYARTGEHPEFGTVTLRQLLATWVVHDLGHLRQIARVLAKQYTDEVGPWAQYLRVVHE